MKQKVVTVCGSYRFWDLIQEISGNLELEQGYVVLGMIPLTSERKLTDKEKELLGELHLRKIDLSDAVFVVNPGGYIGESVRKEIGYALSQGKEILYLEQP